MQIKINNVTAEQLDKWTEMYDQEPFFTAVGVYFGFPDCCIDTFIEQKQHDVSEVYPKLDCTGTGYMPCLCCAKEVHENWLKFKEKINANRFATLKFPNDSNEHELNEFFIDFTLMLGFDPIEVAEQLRSCEEIIDILDQREGKRKEYKRMKVK